MSKINCELIALTGGPGAGKTTVLTLARKILCNHVAILPESAGVVYSGGFWRMESITAKVAAQKAIFHVQREMENLVLNEQKWSVGLCDRGSLDGLAYWPLSEELFWKTFNTSIQQEYARYKAVIHLRSPNLKNGYNYRNPLRIESPDQAAEIDEKIHQVWKGHSNYHIIDSTDSFLNKISQAMDKIDGLTSHCCNKPLVMPGASFK